MQIATRTTQFGLALIGATLLMVATLGASSDVARAADESPNASDRPLIRCGNLIYGRNQKSKCFSHHFLADAEKRINVRTKHKFAEVRSESAELYQYPFVVMSGEGAFTLTAEQRENLAQYLTSGGFLVASPGCSSSAWQSSFRREIAKVLPGVKLEKIPMSHPAFHTVYDIDTLKTKQRGVTAHLEGVIIDGRIVCIYSPEGLNDTSNAGGDCCCCGGNEILNARQVNVNLLAYALTH